jgi:3-dehydroquinate synthase
VRPLSATLQPDGALFGDEPETEERNAEVRLRCQEDDSGCGVGVEAALSRPLYRIPVPAGGSAGNGGYEIVVGSGTWRSLPSLIEKYCLAHRYAIITDHQVAELYGVRLLRSMHAAGHRADVFTYPAGEEQKTRETWMSITDAMLEAGLGRDTAVVALGGGVAGDLGGFVAATYMRGLPVVQLPTTLVAMLDASVGGKTGVNTGAGKNQVGCFWPPRVVVADPDVIATLPPAHRRSGLAEAVKHGAIADREYLERIASQSDSLDAADPEALCELVARSVEIKVEFVGRDERESGPRKALNFGHTVGHALEAATGYVMPHGDAVAIGMVAEARIGERCGTTEAGTADGLRQVLASLGLPTSLPPQLPVARIVDLTHADKKARQGRTEYVLLGRLGSVDPHGGRWSHPVPDEVVREALSGS